ATVRSRTVALVRLAELSAGLVKRALDVGADGVVIPWVESAEQLRQAVRFARYPPAGRRGIGGGRATAWGRVRGRHVRRGGGGGQGSGLIGGGMGGGLFFRALLERLGAGGRRPEVNTEFGAGGGTGARGAGASGWRGRGTSAAPAGRRASATWARRSSRGTRT